MEPQYNEPLYNDILDTTNDFLYPGDGKIYGKEPQYNETSSLRTNFCQSFRPSLYPGATVYANIIHPSVKRPLKMSRLDGRLWEEVAHGGRVTKVSN